MIVCSQTYNIICKLKFGNVLFKQQLSIYLSELLYVEKSQYIIYKAVGYSADFVAVLCSGFVAHTNVCAEHAHALTLALFLAMTSVTASASNFSLKASYVMDLSDLS